MSGHDNNSEQKQSQQQSSGMENQLSRNASDGGPQKEEKRSKDGSSFLSSQNSFQKLSQQNSIQKSSQQNSFQKISQQNSFQQKSQNSLQKNSQQWDSLLISPGSKSKSFDKLTDPRKQDPDLLQLSKSQEFKTSSQNLQTGQPKEEEDGKNPNEPSCNLLLQDGMKAIKSLKKSFNIDSAQPDVPQKSDNLSGGKQKQSSSKEDSNQAQCPDKQLSEQQAQENASGLEGTNEDAETLSLKRKTTEKSESEAATAKKAKNDKRRLRNRQQKSSKRIQQKAFNTGKRKFLTKAMNFRPKKAAAKNQNKKKKTSQNTNLTNKNTQAPKRGRPRKYPESSNGKKSSSLSRQ